MTQKTTSPHYVNGDKSARQVLVLRARKPGEAALREIERGGRYSIATLDRLIADGYAAADFYAESGFYVHASRFAESGGAE